MPRPRLLSPLLEAVREPVVEFTVIGWYMPQQTWLVRHNEEEKVLLMSPMLQRKLADACRRFDTLLGVTVRIKYHEYGESRPVFDITVCN